VSGPILTDEELEIVNETRTILERVEHEAMGRAWEASTDPARPPHPMGFGRLAEAADRAHAAIFNVLNVANAYDVQAIEPAVLYKDTPPPAFERGFKPASRA
jgi:hypothetical protein